MAAYYNEWDQPTAAWLRELIAQGHLPPGDVDTRSITDVQPDDLKGYDQCHFFAGIGGWPLALKMAGWPDDRPVWTGSCPCQPLSSAGQRKGHADERHIWPAFFRIIAECKPPTVFGEQVASRDGREWLSGIRADLEAVGYACGAADLCAAGVGAPHVRQRLYWVADTNRASQRADCWAIRDKWNDVGGGCEVDGRLGDSNGARLQGQWHKHRPHCEGDRRQPGPSMQVSGTEWNGPAISAPCTDGSRRISAEPSAFPVADGVPARVVRLRGYGNAIVPQVAARFVTAAMECIG